MMIAEDVEFPEAWRNITIDSNILIALNVMVRDIGQIRWDDQLKQNVWVPNEINDPNWNVPDDFIWSFLNHSWRRVRFLLPHGRRNHANIEINYIWNNTTSELMMLFPDSIENGLEVGWQTFQFSDPNHYSNIFITCFNKEFEKEGLGRIEYNVPKAIIKVLHE